MSGPPPPIPAPEILELKIITTDVLVEALFLGVQAVVTIMGIFVLWSRGLRKSFGNRLLIGIIMLLFGLSTCSLSLTIWDYMATFDELGGTFDATDISNKATVATMVFQRLAYFISDAVVVWRAWILWDRNIFIKMLLVLCLLGTITATFVQGSLAVHQQIRHTGGVAQGAGTRTLMFSLPLLITNVVASVLFGIRAWEHRRQISSQLQLKASRTFNLVVILLESSVIYCVFWILALLGALGTVFSPVATAAIMGSLPYVTSIYPIVVVILLTVEKDTYESSIQATTETMSFGPTDVSMNDSGARAPEATYFTKKSKSEDSHSLEKA